MTKTAVILFNLGGPDRREAIRPFLFNLFKDPAIIAAPGPLRWLLAHWISLRRAKPARAIYDQIGGASPLLANTQAQARALEAALNAGAPSGSDEETRVFVAMRYWHPFSAETARAVKDFGPDRLVQLPLYPQFSTTTSASSLDDWARAAGRAGLRVPTHALCCYPTEAGFIGEIAGLLEAAIGELAEGTGFRVLFSAHGLPERVIEAGDPYQWQVEASAAAVVEELIQRDQRYQNLDWVICYQSRVGPLVWIGPATKDEITRAGADGLALVVVPIAFVSEHSETLVELDRDFARHARASGVPHYRRVPTVGDGKIFIEGLARLVRGALDGSGEICSHRGGRVCPARWGRCPLGEHSMSGGNGARI